MSFSSFVCATFFWQLLSLHLHITQENHDQVLWAMYHFHFWEVCRFFIIENIARTFAELLLLRIAHAILSSFSFFLLTFIVFFPLKILVACHVFLHIATCLSSSHTKKLMTMTFFGMKWLVFSSILNIDSAWQRFQQHFEFFLAHQK